MAYENLWNINSESQNDIKRTDNIFKIMENQCNYLYRDTNGRVFAVFGEIKTDGSIIAAANTFSNILKGISGVPVLKEYVDGISTNNLIDANEMYFDKRYGFEICTEKYRFRLFSLRITPLYPVEIKVDEGICRHIENDVTKIANPMDQFNQFEICDEEVFCEVLQKILQDKKVRYIISELEKRVQDEDKKEADVLHKKIIICEGATEEAIIQAIAQKIGQKVTIFVADGKYSLPASFEAVKQKNGDSNIMILVDSDGNEEETRKRIKEKIDSDNYKLVVINDQIEDWFMPEVTDFGKLKMMQSIGQIVDEIDLKELSKTHESFAQVLEFLQSS